MKIVTDKEKEIIRNVYKVLEDAESSENIRFSDDDREFLKELMSDADEYDDYVVKLRKINIDERAKRLLQKIEPKRNIKHSHRRLVYVITAAAVIALSMLVWRDNNMSDVSQPVIVAADAPVISKPTLITLSNDKHELTTENVSEAIALSKKTKEVSPADSEIEDITIVIPAKYTYKIDLPDGSEVILNANSSLTLPEQFTGDSRIVKLKGEAYFNIKKSDKPFIVSANNSYVKVYGTEFNVNARDSVNTKTILVSGSVGVGQTNREPVIIKPNQMAVVNAHDLSCVVTEVDVSIYIDWINGNITADLTPMIDIINEVEAWYDVEFAYSEEEIKDIKLSFTMSKNSSIESLVDVIEMASGKSINLIDGKYEVE